MLGGGARIGARGDSIQRSHSHMGTATASRLRADRNVREDDDISSTRTTGDFWRRDNGVEEPDAFRVSSPHEGCRSADFRQLSCWHQHAACWARSGVTVPWCLFERHGQPSLAEDQGRLGGLKKRDLGPEDIVGLILDGTTVRVRIDRKARRFRCLSCLGYAAMVRKFCLPFAAWAGRAKRLGARCWTTRANLYSVGALITGGTSRKAILAMGPLLSLPRTKFVLSGSPVRQAIKQDDNA